MFKLLSIAAICWAAKSTDPEHEGGSKTWQKVLVDTVASGLPSTSTVVQGLMSGVVKSVINGINAQPDANQAIESSTTLKNAFKWTTDDVCDWLETMGLGEHNESFRKHRVDGPTLHGLDDDILANELGVSSRLQRKKFAGHLTQLKQSSVEHCKGHWSPWDSCSVDCTTSRTFHITIPPILGGMPCEHKEGAVEHRNCTDGNCFIDCIVGDWHTSHQCSVSCGVGQVREIRDVLQKSRGQGKPCPELQRTLECRKQPCPQDCMGHWLPWDQCSHDCVTKRVFEITTPALHGGRPCIHKNHEGQQRQCVDGSCAIDCQVSSWSQVGECTLPCGGGRQRSVREVIVRPLGHGVACPSLEKSEGCNTQDCRYAPLLQNLRSSLANFSSSEPVLEAVKKDYEGFKDLVKSSHDVDDPHGRDWVSFVENVRAMGSDYRQGEKMLHRCLVKMMTFAKQAPTELDTIFSELCAGQVDLAQIRFNKFCNKFKEINGGFDSIDKHFGKMEEQVKDYRETASDQKAEFSEDMQTINALGAGVDLGSVPGFAQVDAIDHRGNDIACGRYSKAVDLAFACRQDSTCVGFSIWDGKPWCLKHALHSVPEQDRTHVFYTKVQINGGRPTSVAKVQKYYDRWTFGYHLMIKIEDRIKAVVQKVSYIHEQLSVMQEAIDEMKELLRVDMNAKGRVEALITEIGEGFLDIVKYIKPSV